MKPILIIFFCLAATLTQAQQNIDSVSAEVKEHVKTKAIDSLKTLQVLDTAKPANELRGAANEAVQDSLGVGVPDLDTTEVIDNVKSTTKRAAEDSLSNYVDAHNVKLDSSFTDEVEQAIKKKIETAVGTSIPTDSSVVKDEVKRLAKDEFKNQTDIDAPDITLDSTTMDQLKTETESRVEGMVKDTDEFKALKGSDSELSELNETKEELEQTQQQIKKQQERKELKQKMATQAKDYISEHAEEIQQMQSPMGELKQKYSYMPNSNDLSTAKKRSSLKGESFWKRLVVGGNFNVSKTNPLNIDLSPVLGWKFNQLFEVGVTGAYRAKFGTGNSGVNTFEDEEVYGYSVFANHMVFKNFFGYVEGENMSKVTGTNENNGREWHQTLLAGIGRKFHIAKFLEMQAIVTYNLLHDNNDGLYESPIVFKTGFRIKK